MITHFDNFFGGHIDLPDIGYSGIPVDDRVEPDARLSTVFDEARAIAEVMDQSGYDTLWLAEHHFQREGYGCIPNIPMLAVYLSQVTGRLHFGSMFNTVPAWHPLRLAEDYALADVLTKGRFRFGIGRGYIAREVETLGSPLDDDQMNRDLFEEQVEILFKAWNTSAFSHRGKYYDLPARIRHRGRDLHDITLVPRPVTHPVTCWQPIVSVNPRGIAFMVKHGINGVVPGGARVYEIAEKWREALSVAGRETEPGTDLAVVVQIHLADTREQAIQEATVWYEEQVKVLAPLGMMPSLTSAQIEATRDPVRAPLAGLPTVRDLERDGSWLCGPPELLIEKIEAIQEKLPGLSRLVVGAGGLGIPPDVIRQDLQWFGREVLPKFSRGNQVV